MQEEDGFSCLWVLNQSDATVDQYTLEIFYRWQLTPRLALTGDLQYLKVGKGKYFTFFRPYHLWFLEAPISIARSAAAVSVVKNGLPVPAARITTRPFSRCLTARRRM